MPTEEGSKHTLPKATSTTTVDKETTDCLSRTCSKNESNVQIGGKTSQKWISRDQC